MAKDGSMQVRGAAGEDPGSTDGRRGTYVGGVNLCLTVEGVPEQAMVRGGGRTRRLTTNRYRAERQRLGIRYCR